jgi:hypothetical protein
MNDLAWLLLIVALFAIARLFARLCERLMG